MKIAILGAGNVGELLASAGRAPLIGSCLE